MLKKIILIFIILWILKLGINKFLTLILLILIIGGFKMGLYGFGNNKCKKEVYPKTEVYSKEEVYNKEETNAKYQLKGDYVVITGQIQLPEAGAGTLTGAVEVDYPEGFTQDNCVIISVLSNSQMHTDYWSTQLGNSTSASMIFGNFGFATLKPNKIRYASNKLDDSQNTQTISYKIVLMKIN